MQECEKYMYEAAIEARKALCLRAKCGSVIVKGEEVIGRGYNAPALNDIQNRMCEAQFPPGKPKYDKTCCMHAEWRAIMNALASNPQKIKGSALYFVRVDEEGNAKRSGRPFCTVCSRLALDAGIATFALWHEDGIRHYPTREYNILSYQYEHEG